MKLSKYFLKIGKEKCAEIEYHLHLASTNPHLTLNIFLASNDPHLYLIFYVKYILKIMYCLCDFYLHCSIDILLLKTFRCLGLELDTFFPIKMNGYIYII